MCELCELLPCSCGDCPMLPLSLYPGNELYMHPTDMHVSYWQLICKSMAARILTHIEVSDFGLRVGGEWVFDVAVLWDS